MAGRKKDIVINIKNEEDFLKYYHENHEKLVGSKLKIIALLLVLDIHPEWSGPCELIQPTFKSLSTQIDDFDSRVDILSRGQVIGEVDGANVPLLQDKIEKNIPY